MSIFLPIITTINRQIQTVYVNVQYSWNKLPNFLHICIYQSATKTAEPAKLHTRIRTFMNVFFGMKLLFELSLISSDIQNLYKKVSICKSKISVKWIVEEKISLIKIVYFWNFVICVQCNWKWSSWLYRLFCYCVVSVLRQVFCISHGINSECIKIGIQLRQCLQPQLNLCNWFQCNIITPKSSKLLMSSPLLS